MADLDRFDSDPDALAWAREHVQFYIDKARKFESQATELGNAEMASGWRRIANYLDMKLIGNHNCAIAAFDERRPQMVKMLKGASDA